MTTFRAMQVESIQVHPLRDDWFIVVEIDPRDPSLPQSSDARFSHLYRFNENDGRVWYDDDYKEAWCDVTDAPWHYNAVQAVLALIAERSLMSSDDPQVS